MNKLQRQVLIKENSNENDEIIVSKNDAWSTVRVAGINGLRMIFDVVKFPLKGSRPALILLRFSSKDGLEISSDGLYYQSSSGHAFAYFEPTSKGPLALDAPIPLGTHTLSFSVQPWQNTTESMALVNTVKLVDFKQTTKYPKFKPINNSTNESPDSGLKDKKNPKLTSNKTLTNAPIWFDFDTNGKRAFAAQIHLAQGTPDSKAAVCRVEFLDSESKTLPAGKWIAESPLVGHFFYVPRDERDSHRKLLLAPRGTKRIRLGIQSWNSTETQLTRPIELHDATIQEAERTFGVSISSRKKPRDIKVAFIVDEFTYNSFKYECNAIVLTPSNWREQMTEHEPDLLFCESAWSGTDSELRPWKGRIYGSVNFPRENRTELFDIIQYCRNNEIPTVFWNKEDPTHFDDRVHDFVDTAKRFDFVFTTAQECVERYRTQYGIKNIDVLPFATQPRLFNPVGSEGRSSGVTFAGGWYANHEKRCFDTAEIFDVVIESGMDLKIYDRFYGSDDKLHQFPESYRRYTVPPLPHSNISGAYKLSDYGININTVVDSPTMFARRVFELASCNTLIISNPAEGLGTFFDDEILIIDAKEPHHKNLAKLKSFDSEKLKQKALTKVLSEHTYRHRFAQVLDTVGIQYIPIQRRINLVCKVSSRQEAEMAVTYAHRLGDIVEILMLLVTEETPSSSVQELYQEFNKFGVQVMSAEARSRYGAYEQISESDSDVLVTDIEKLGHLGVERIEKMLIHREYSEDILAFTDNQTKRYTFTASTDAEIVLIPAEKFTWSVLENDKLKGHIYNV